MRPLALILLGLAAACTASAPADDDTDTTDADTSCGDVSAGTGCLALRFQIDDALEAQLEEDPIGPFNGSLYKAEEATALGPVDGAEAIASIEVDSVDLTPLGDKTEILWTSDPLPAGFVRVLGFVDSDGSDPSGPDYKDPVTFPPLNEFEIVAGQLSEGTVFFSLLNPTQGDPRETDPTDSTDPTDATDSTTSTDSTD